VALNAFLLAVGVAIVYGVRGLATWAEAARLAGLAYLLAVAGVGVALVGELVVGIDLSLASVLVTGLVLGGAGILAGQRLGRASPSRPRPRVPRLNPVTAVAAALSAVYFEALFRSGRLAGLYEFDGWAFWIPKAKAIYYFGGLDEQLFRELPGQSYPPLVPALEATAFHFMGAADEVTLHLQFWFLLVGFAAAAIGLLAGRVPRLLAWSPLLAVLVTPHVIVYALQVQGDFLLDELFAVAALLVALWLTDRQPWQLVCAGVLLAGAMSTKREGYLFTACLVFAALIAAVSHHRKAWPQLVALGVAAAALTVPWRVLLLVRDLSGGGAEAGGTGLFSHLDRVWPSFRLALSALFDYDIWLVTAPIAVVAVAVAVLAGAWRLAAFAALLFLALLAGFTWITWSFPSLPITKDAALNPIVRAAGGFVLVSATLVPVLLGAAWTAYDRRRATP
jgi:hypothetical protein